jgi:hypothetical protein
MYFSHLLSPPKRDADIMTHVCDKFPKMSLIQEGYCVYVPAEASGTFNERIAREASDRMRVAGVQITLALS